MNNLPFLLKYRPNIINDFIMYEDNKAVLRSLLEISNLNLLLLGPISCGKSSLINILINEYFKDKQKNSENILYINSLKDQGINFYRTEVKTFCQSKSLDKYKKKLIIIDDIDTLNEQSQQVFRNSLDKYSDNINIICSATNSQKVVDSIQSRLLSIKMCKLNNDQLLEILCRVKKIEGLTFPDDINNFIINVSNNSVRLILNYLEKIKLYGKDITLENYKDFCSNISYIELENFTLAWFNNDIGESIKILYSLVNCGYSVIDILDGYYGFIKILNHSLITEELKYNIIQVICKYIAIFHSNSEDELELCCLSLDLCKLVS
jgi:DNA polymerase III delta prime subunit